MGEASAGNGSQTPFFTSLAPALASVYERVGGVLERAARWAKKEETEGRADETHNRQWRADQTPHHCGCSLESSGESGVCRQPPSRSSV